MARFRKCPVCKKEELTLPGERQANMCIYCDTKTNCLLESEPITHVSGYERIVIPPKVWAKMQYWCKIAPGEISGLGTIQKQSDDTLVFTNIIMLPQVNSQANT